MNAVSLGGYVSLAASAVGLALWAIFRERIGEWFKRADASSAAAASGQWKAVEAAVNAAPTMLAQLQTELVSLRTELAQARKAQSETNQQHAAETTALRQRVEAAEKRSRRARSMYADRRRRFREVRKQDREKIIALTFKLSEVESTLATTQTALAATQSLAQAFGEWGDELLTIAHEVAKGGPRRHLSPPPMPAVLQRRASDPPKADGSSEQEGG